MTTATLHQAPMLFVHGWGQSASIWFEQRQHFTAARFVNLPGHGGAADLPAENWLKALESQLPDQPCILVGWSLGGMLAMQLAQRAPERLAGLVLVSSTPCFVQKTDWPHGCDTPTFAAFEAGIHAPEKERQHTLSRFFALMLHGDGLSRAAFNRLARQAVNRQHPTSQAGLEQGLHLLSELDLRADVTPRSVPTLILHGEQDAIVPFAAGQALTRQMPQAGLQAFADCGHAPFLSQAHKFNDTLEAWCQTL